MKLYCHPASTTCRTIMLFAAEEGVDLLAGGRVKPEYASMRGRSFVTV